MSHIPTDVVQSFLTPDINDARLQTASDVFECAIQKRLSSKQNTISINFDLDIYRHVFGTNQSVVLHSVFELNKLPICANWFYKLKGDSKGIQIIFPIRITPQLRMRPVYIKDNDLFVKRMLPIEKIVIVSAIGPFV